MAVSKDKSFCIVSKAGEVGLSTGLDKEWARSYPDKTQKIAGRTLDNACFFNKDTGFLSGFLSGENSSYDFVYHTTDGGKNWNIIKFGQSGWVDDAINLDNGEAWLSVAGSGLAYTNDFGMHWNKINIPSTKDRYHKIFFNKSHQGIMGSLWNKLIYTTDNGKNWSSLPTPLDQKKYNKTNKGSRPELDKVAIYGQQLLVMQEGILFYSRIDSIDWKELPAYREFFTDVENSSLFFKLRKSGYAFSNNSFQPLKQFDIPESVLDADCMNGSLYLLSHKKLFELSPNQELQQFAFNTNTTSPPQPALFAYTLKGGLGYHKNKLYLQEKYDGPWTYVTDLPINTDSGYLYMNNDQKIQFADIHDSLIVMDISGNILQRKTVSGLINEFIKSDITKIKFTIGSRGCFHFYEDAIEYTLHGTTYDNPIGVANGQSGKLSLPENPESISYEDVQSFQKYLPDLFRHEHITTIEEMGFTTEDYNRLKKDIQKFKQYVEAGKKKDKEPEFMYYRNNIDFNKLLQLVDSIPNIRPEILNYCLSNTEGGWSTTTNWISFQLINSKNEVLYVTHNNYFNKGIHLPWTINLKGHQIQSTDYTINQFLYKVYPEFAEKKNNYSFLYQLIKILYEQHE